VVRSLSSSCRMRSVFSRIALMLRNINLGGAFSGIRSNSRPKSRPLERDARRLTTNAAPVTAGPFDRFAAVRQQSEFVAIAFSDR
jgi:hypothetical protein